MTKKLLSILKETNNTKEITEFLEKVLKNSLKKNSQNAELYLINQKKKNVISQRELAYKYASKMNMGIFFYLPAIFLAIELQKAVLEKSHILAGVLIAYKNGNIAEAVRLLHTLILCACKEKKHPLRMIAEKLSEGLKHVAIVKNASDYLNNFDSQLKTGMKITQALNVKKYEYAETELDDEGVDGSSGSTEKYTITEIFDWQNFYSDPNARIIETILDADSISIAELSKCFFPRTVFFPSDSSNFTPEIATQPAQILKFFQSLFEKWEVEIANRKMQPESDLFKEMLCNPPDQNRTITEVTLLTDVTQFV